MTALDQYSQGKAQGMYQSRQNYLLMDKRNVVKYNMHKAMHSQNPQSVEN